MRDFTAASVFGMTTAAPIVNPINAAPTQAMAPIDDGDIGWRNLMNPSNPLFWFGAVFAGTMALIGVAGVQVKAKAGPARASAGVGKPD